MENHNMLMAIEDHPMTRILWEKVFKEDTEAFLDYYYTYVTDHNEIYVLREQGEIISMLHLNPYEVVHAGRLFKINYIVAVATLEAHRKKGHMRTLLTQALQDMYHKTLPLTYLMPAAESIYTPYDFVVVTSQTHYKYSGELNDNHFPSSVGGFTFAYATASDCDTLSDFANDFFNRNYRVFTRRTPLYFSRMIKEQDSQNGGIILIKKHNNLLGYFILAMETNVSIREFLIIEKYHNIILEVLNLEAVDSIPMMVRITNVEKILPCLKFQNGDRKIIQVEDTIIPENTGTYQLSPSYSGMKCKKLSSEVKKEEALSMAELTTMVFENAAILLNEIV